LLDGRAKENLVGGVGFEEGFLPPPPGYGYGGLAIAVGPISE
jgi:hypothetical protein